MGTTSSCSSICALWCGKCPKECQPPTIGLVLVWYDVLLELERSDKAGLRPFELEQELLLPQYGISRLIDRIEKAGHLRRETCQNDGRGLRLLITKTGKKLRRQMWIVYGPAIESAVGKNLNSTQASELSNLLAQLID